MAEVTDAEPSGGWVRVTDRLPTAAGRYLICAAGVYRQDHDSGKPLMTSSLYDMGRGWAIEDPCSSNRVNRVTHWRELPAPPDPEADAEADRRRRETKDAVFRRLAARGYYGRGDESPDAGGAPWYGRGESAPSHPKRPY